MCLSLRTALIGSLVAHLSLSHSRLETLSALMTGLIHDRTVNVSHIASHCPGRARHTSKYRHLQRFLQSVRFDQAVIATLVVRMLHLARPKCLALDRIQWKSGRTDVNILMLAIVTRRFRLPLL